MTQIDGLGHSKATVCSSKTVNFRHQNRRFTPLISQNSKTVIHVLSSRHRNKAVAKGLKVAIFLCQDFRPLFNISLTLDWADSESCGPITSSSDSKNYEKLDILHSFQQKKGKKLHIIRKSITFAPIQLFYKLLIYKNYEEIHDFYRGTGYEPVFRIV